MTDDALELLRGLLDTDAQTAQRAASAAEFFDVPESSISSILERSKKNYGVEFDNDSWRIERERVRAGEKELDPLGDD